MPATKTSTKTELVHPRSGRKMNIDSEIYDHISKAICRELKSKDALSFTDLADGVRKCLKSQKVKLEGSVDWYTISIRNDMETKGLIRKFKEKGQMMNALAK